MVAAGSSFFTVADQYPSPGRSDPEIVVWLRGQRDASTESLRCLPLVHAIALGGPALVLYLTEVRVTNSSMLAVIGRAPELGIRTSSAADLVLTVGEMTVFAALALTILVKVAPTHYSMAVFSQASSPHGSLAGIATFASVYGDDVRSRCVNSGRATKLRLASHFYPCEGGSSPPRPRSI